MKNETCCGLALALVAFGALVALGPPGETHDPEAGWPPLLESNVIWGWKLADPDARTRVNTSFPYQLGLREDGMVVWRWRTNATQTTTSK